jgi:hypothetical protein
MGRGRKPKDLTKEERKGENSFAMWKELIDNISEIRNKTIRNAEIFTEIYDHQGWRDIVGEGSEWSALLGQVEVFYTRAEVSRWMLLWRKLHNEFGLNLEDVFDVPVVRLEKIASYSETSKQAQELVDKARAMPRKDWDDEVLTLKGKPTSLECDHEGGFMKIEKCKTCGSKKHEG